MKTTFLSFLLLLAFSNVRADDYLLKGNIGKYPVVFDLFMSGNQIEGTYFYTSSCIDIVLKGERTDNGVVLYASHYNGNTEDTTETWRVTENANKSWTGKWIGKKGKVYDVVLAPLDIKTIITPYDRLPVARELKTSSEYNYIRLAHLPVVKDTATVKNGKYILRYYHLKNAAIDMFEVVGGLDKQIATKVNDLLLNKFLENAWNYCGCTGSDTPDYQYTIDNVFLSDNVLSVNIAVEFYCNQAAHPEGGNDPVTIDLKTGRQLVLEDILSLGTGPVPSEQSENWGSYREGVYGPKLLALMKKLYPKQLATSNECDYSVVEPWEVAQFYVTENGLYLSPSFPHAAVSCRNPDWSYISFEELKKHKNPKKPITLP